MCIYTKHTYKKAYTDLFLTNFTLLILLKKYIYKREQVSTKINIKFGLV